MNILDRITHSIRATRLRMAEQDLTWMETIGMRNLAAQRARVADMRAQLGRNSTAPVRANDIARAVAQRTRATPF